MSEWPVPRGLYAPRVGEAIREDGSMIEQPVPEQPGVPYPAHREVDVALRDGSTVHVRPVRRDDRDAILALFRDMSAESRWLRFFSGAVNLERVADSSVDVDYRDRYGLVATAGPEHRVVGHAAYL